MGPFFKVSLYFGIMLSLQKSSKDSTDNFHMRFAQLSLMLTSSVTMITFVKTKANVGLLPDSDFIPFLPVLPLMSFFLLQDPTQDPTLHLVFFFKLMYTEKYLEGDR